MAGKSKTKSPSTPRMLFPRKSKASPSKSRKGPYLGLTAMLLALGLSFLAGPLSAAVIPGSGSAVGIPSGCSEGQYPAYDADGRLTGCGTDADSGAGANALQNTASGVWLSTHTLGIGTTSPAARLDVRGSILSTGPVTIQGSTLTVSGAGFSVGTSTFVVSLGKVGIGTMAPTSLLDILTPTSAAPYQLGRFNFHTADSNDSPLIHLYSDNSAVGMQIGYYPQTFASFPGWGYVSVASDTDKGFLINVGNNSYTLVFATNGRMGLGTSSPSYKFHSVSDAGTTGTIMAVSTGTTPLFAVHGTSVSLEVPLVFPDGSVMTSAASGAGDITAVNAGNGMTGNCASGDCTVAVDPATTTMLGPSIDLSGAEATGTLAAARFPALTGDVTTSAGNLATTIADNSVDGTDIALGSDAAGDIMYYDGTNYVRLAKGTAGQVLEMNAGATAPEWDTDDTAAGGGDNFGTHIATMNVDMAGFMIMNVSSLSFTGSQAPVLKTTYTTTAFQVTDTTDNDFVVGETSVTAQGLYVSAKGEFGTDLEIPHSDDPDVGEAGEISQDDDGWLRVYDGAVQKGIRIHETFSVRVSSPNALPDAERDAYYFFINKSSMTFTITSWSAMADTDDTSLAIEKCDGDGGNAATMDAVEIAANATGFFTASDATITAATLTAGQAWRLDFDDTDTPGWVVISIDGYWVADVN